MDRVKDEKKCFPGYKCLKSRVKQKKTTLIQFRQTPRVINKHF